MVKIALQIKATLDNIQELRTPPCTFQWCLKFICCNCGELSTKWHYVSESVFIPLPRGNTVRHFTKKCKICSRENSMSIVPNSTQPYTADDRDYKTIVVFNCTGFELGDFSPGDGWIAKAIDGGKEFTDVDFLANEWEDYCDKINQPVGIYELQHKFVKIS